MADRLRIAVYHNLPSGGGKRALFNHVKALKDRGHYLEAWTTDLEMNHLPLSDLITEHKLPVRSGLNAAFNKRSPVRKTDGMINALKDHASKCASEIEKAGFDIVFANSSLYTYISYIGHFTKLPSVIYLGEPYRLLYEAFPENIWQAQSYPFRLRNLNKFRRDFLTTYARRIQVREEIHAASSYKAILVNSYFSRESIRRAYGIEARVCYLGVDENSYDLTIHRKQPYVAGLGKITDSKGIDRAIKAVSEIRKEIRPVIKWISNGYDEPYLVQIKELAESLEVDLIPMIDIDEGSLKETLGMASVMIYAPKLEPFGLAPLEANMCGTYVIAVAEGGIRESIVNDLNGTLFSDFDAGKMAAEIEKFIINPEFAAIKGEDARRHTANKWSFRSMGDNIENELYRTLSVQ